MFNKYNKKINNKLLQIMFKLFRKKSRAELMEKKYQELLKDAYKLSTINRKASDRKMAEADQLLREMEIKNVV